MRYLSQPQKAQPQKIHVRRSRTFLLKKLGFCLGSLGLLGNSIAVTQVAQAQTSVIPPMQLDSAAPVEVPSQDSMPPELLAPSTPHLARTEVTIDPAPPAEAPAADADVAPPIELETPPLPEPIEASPAPNSGYEAPATVIFSERSSGCETSAAMGQVVGEVCGGAAATVPVPPGSAPAQDAAVVPPIQVEGMKPEPKSAAIAPPKTLARPTAIAPLGQTWAPSSLSVIPPSIKPYFSSKLRALKLPKVAKLNMIFPLAVPSEITSLFGWRIHPISGDQRMHTGTDLGAPMGTPVLAALTGRVLLSDFLGGYGLTVALEHSQGTQQTLYAHLSETFVKPGETVQQGTVIGRVGSTGNSTGPHLHFELRQQLEDGSWVAQDAGAELEFAMAQLVQSLQIAQNPQKIAQGQVAIAPTAANATAANATPVNATAANATPVNATLSRPLVTPAQSNLTNAALAKAPTLPAATLPLQLHPPLAQGIFKKGRIPDRDRVQ